MQCQPVCADRDTVAQLQDTQLAVHAGLMSSPEHEDHLPGLQLGALVAAGNGSRGMLSRLLCRAARARGSLCLAFWQRLVCLRSSFVISSRQAVTDFGQAGSYKWLQQRAIVHVCTCTSALKACTAVSPEETNQQASDCQVAQRARAYSLLTRSLIGSALLAGGP